MIVPLHMVETIKKVSYDKVLFPNGKGGWHIQKMRIDKLKDNPKVKQD